MSTIWDEIDQREARYKAECAATLELIKGMVSARFPSTCGGCGRPVDDGPHCAGDELYSPIGEITCGQDEFGWWRSTVKLSIGFGGAPPAQQWRDLTYQARSSEGLVQAVRERKEAA